MAEEPTLKQVPEQLVLAKRVRGRFEDYGKTLGEVMAQAQASGAQMAGPPMMLCHHYEGPGHDADYEVAIPIARPVAAAQGVEVKRLPQERVVAMMHKGAYADLAESYDRIQRWAVEQGLELRMPDREVYLTNPAEVAPSENLTEIQWPVEP